MQNNNFVNISTNLHNYNNLLKQIYNNIPTNIDKLSVGIFEKYIIYKHIIKNIPAINFLISIGNLLFLGYRCFCIKYSS